MYFISIYVISIDYEYHIILQLTVFIILVIQVQYSIEYVRIEYGCNHSSYVNRCGYEDEGVGMDMWSRACKIKRAGVKGVGTCA